MPGRRAGRAGACAAGALVLLFAAPARAAPQLEADLSPDRVAPGEQAVYTLTVSDAEGGELSFPDFSPLVVRHQSNSMQSVFSFSGGRQGVRTSRVYTWYLEPPRAGTFEIPPATLKLQNRQFRSNAVSLKCDAAVAQPAPRPQPRAQPRSPFAGLDPFDDPAEPDMWGFGGDPWRRPGEGDVFLRTVVDRGEVYLGEQITLTVYLFSQADVAGVQTLSFPRLDGFWAEDLETPTQLLPELRTLNGVTYRAYMLRRRALFPLRSGDVTIDPVEAQVNLGLALFFGARGETVKRRSAPVKLVVKPLPADGQPPAFEASNVGAWSLEARATPTTLALGQPVQLRLALEGTGNLKGLRLPALKVPDGLKTYDPTSTDKVRIAGGRYGGSRTLEYVVIPQRTGQFVLPPVELAYFHPGEGAYRVAATQPIALTVTAAAGGATAPSGPGAAAVAAPGATNVLGAGPRPARLGASLVPRTDAPVWAQPWFWPLVAAPPSLWALGWAGALLLGLVRRRDPIKRREKRARAASLRRLRDAEKLAAASRAAEFYGEVSRALVEFVTDRSGIAALGLTRDALAERMRLDGFDAGHVARLVRLLEACETARFAPLGASEGQMSRVLAEARKLVDALDTGVRRAA